MYYKKKTQIILGFIVVFLIIGSTLFTSVNLNPTNGNPISNESSSNNKNVTSQNGLMKALGDESTDDLTKVSDTYEFLKSKLHSFAQKGQDITVVNSEVETDDSIINIVTIQVENETHIETMTFTAKFDKDQYSGPINEDVDFLLTPDDVEHNSPITFPTIKMGWQYGWWYHYDWEFEIKIKVLWWWITVFRAYFEVSVGAIFRFEMPVSLTADLPDEIPPGFTGTIPIDLTLTALDLKKPGGQEYYEFALGAGVTVRAGAYVLGVIGFGYKLNFGWFEYASYKTPLGEPWYGPPIPIGILGLASEVVPPPVGPILGWIADNLLDTSIYVYPGIGSHKVTAQATVYGTGVTIDGVKSKEINWGTSGQQQLIDLEITDVTTDIVLAFSSFTIHFNELWFKFDFVLEWQWLLSFLDDIPIPIGEVVIATPESIFTMQSSQSVLIPFTITPLEYGVDLKEIPSHDPIEAGSSATYTLTIQNTGTTIDTFELSVFEPESVIDPDWVIFLPKSVILDPGETTTVQMIVHPPRDYTTTAGDYPFKIRATSLGSLGTDPLDPKFDDSLGNLNILPFYDVVVRRYSHLESGVLEILCQDTDIVEFTVQNLGNDVDTFEFSVSSDWGTDGFNIPEPIELQPGETATVQLGITPPYVHSNYYEVNLISTSTNSKVPGQGPVIKDNANIIIRVLPTQDSIMHFLNMLIDELYTEIPEDAWVKLSRRNAMVRRITALIDTMAESGPEFYGEAYDRLLREIKPKLTGLKTNEEEIPWDGGIYNDPWIIIELYQEILQYTCNQLLIDIRTLIAIST
ncbi:MAG: hypothetical protein ACFFE4_06295 [Candidatus Thorarchaeota archaeon]